MINVKTILHHGGSCPFQLEGLTDWDEEVYVRYRGGNLRVDVNGKTVFSKRIGENETDESLLEGIKRIDWDHKGDPDLIQKRLKSYQMMREANGGYLCFDGYLSIEELIEATKEHINWPEEFISLV